MTRDKTRDTLNIVLFITGIITASSLFDNAPLANELGELIGLVYITLVVSTIWRVSILVQDIKRRKHRSDSGTEVNFEELHKSHARLEEAKKQFEEAKQKLRWAEKDYDRHDY